MPSLVLVLLLVLVCLWFSNVFSLYPSVDSQFHFKVEPWIITFQKGLGHLLYPIRMLMVLKLVMALVQMLEGTTIYGLPFLYGMPVSSVAA